MKNPLATVLIKLKIGIMKIANDVLIDYNKCYRVENIVLFRIRRHGR
jgi:hypothetical protein